MVILRSNNTSENTNLIRCSDCGNILVSFGDYIEVSVENLVYFCNVCGAGGRKIENIKYYDDCGDDKGKKETKYRNYVIKGPVLTRSTKKKGCIPSYEDPLTEKLRILREKKKGLSKVGGTSSAAEQLGKKLD